VDGGDLAGVDLGQSGHGGVLLGPGCQLEGGDGRAGSGRRPVRNIGTGSGARRSRAFSGAPGGVRDTTKDAAIKGTDAVKRAAAAAAVDDQTT